MIRHCVFFKYRHDASEKERQAAIDGLAALRFEIDGIEAAHFGANVSPEGLGRGYSDGFVMDLTDAAARDAYLVHPSHQKAGAQLVSVVEGGKDGLLVFDLEIDG